ncbi:hypothetical protein SLEP1_g57841 [Rubroshorea leprosula]|uniref:Uncharacterized protein n=1 Tax=Rubroshorea leprosula TaxID=152421 RepID=A0AAV5MMD3_9ROSI|nr:hypothetical protein SLEP1_g57841 [Rubroshorea leprosula]
MMAEGTFRTFFVLFYVFANCYCFAVHFQSLLLNL